MAQRSIRKEKSKNIGGKRERIPMIRNPKQKMEDKKSSIQRVKGKKDKTVVANQKKKGVSLERMKRKKQEAELPPEDEDKASEISDD